MFLILLFSLFHSNTLIQLVFAIKIDYLIINKTANAVGQIMVQYFTIYVLLARIINSETWP